MFIWQYFTLVCLWFASNEAKSIKKSHVNLLEPTFDLDEKLGRMGIPPPDISNDVQRVQVPLGAAPGKDDWQGKWFPQDPEEPHKSKQKICDDGKVGTNLIPELGKSPLKKLDSTL